MHNRKDTPPVAAGKTGTPCETVALASVRAFCGLLEESIDHNAGSLTQADLKAAFQAFSGRSGNRQRFYDDAHDACVRGLTEERRRKHRRDVFGRMMVRPFEHLLVDGPDPVEEPPVVHREALFGFFRALTLMLGEEVIEARRALCQDVLDGLEEGHSHDVDWDRFHSETSVRQVLARTVADIAACFANFGRRADWFVSLLAYNGADGASCTRDGDGGYAFGHYEFAALMRALVSALDGAGEGPGAGIALRPGDRPAITDFLENLERLEQQVGLVPGATPGQAPAPQLS